MPINVNKAHPLQAASVVVCEAEDGTKMVAVGLDWLEGGGETVVMMSEEAVRLGAMLMVKGKEALGK